MTEGHQIHIKNRNLQIGNICCQWAHLELLLAHAIWSLLDVSDEVGLTITGKLAIEPRAHMAVVLSEKVGQSEEVTTALKKVQKELQKSKITEGRNRAVHGHRFPDPDDPAAELIVMHRGKDAGKKIKRTDDELLKIFTRIYSRF